MFPKVFGYTGVRETMTKFMKETIQEHRQTMEVGNPRDFIDSFLEESIKTKGDPNSSFHDDAEGPVNPHHLKIFFFGQHIGREGYCLCKWRNCVIIN